MASSKASKDGQMTSREEQSPSSYQAQVTEEDLLADPRLAGPTPRTTEEMYEHSELVLEVINEMLRKEREAAEKAESTRYINKVSGREEHNPCWEVNNGNCVGYEEEPKPGLWDIILGCGAILAILVILSCFAWIFLSCLASLL